MDTTDKTVDLDDRAVAELLGGLQIGRDKLRADGMTGDGVADVLDQIYTLVQPATAGLRISELRHIAPSRTRYALVRAQAGQADQIRAYLPDNYAIVGRTAIQGSNVVQFLLTGHDVAGWTLDGYVLPRLASGMYYGEEIS